ncbi:MAG: FAD:protein FMN transferase [Croceitalea sp.]|nr:FAD:protein FMN transferase [Croceitalea sp.]
MRIFLTLLSIIVLMACETRPGPVKNQKVGNALGTTYSIIYLSEEPLELQQQIDSIFRVVNQSMSTYMPQSDISLINKGDTTVVVDTMFKEVFEISSKVHKATNGYFDPTVGILVNAWGFGPGKQISMDSTEIDSLMHFVGWEKVGLHSNGTVMKQHPEIQFDFNAVAKGYAIDRIGALLDSKNVSDYLIEVGGEVLTSGENRITNKKWTVGIDDPQVTEGRALKLIIYLKDKALASSGNYRKYRVDPDTGEKFVHTIDSKTGYTKNSKVLAASVIAGNCATADAYATAFMAMELEDSKNILQSKRELDAYIIYLDDAGTTQEFMTEGFKALVAQ